MDPANSSLANFHTALSASQAALERIPAETILEICSYLVPCFGYAPPAEVDTSSADWRNVQLLMSISPRWKSVILTSPCVWTYVKPRELQPEQLQQYLGRSRELPLDVDLLLQHPESTWMAEMLSEVAPRLNKLTISIGADCADTHNELMDALSKTLFLEEAPALEDFTFSMDSEIDLIYAFQVDCEVPLIFKGSLPSLRRLHLAGVSIWNPENFKNLTDIRIDRCFMAHFQHKNTLKPIHTLLRNSPLVCRVVIRLSLVSEGLGESEPEEGSLSVESIRLDHLELLELDERCWQITEFLTPLIIPPDAIIKLTTTNEVFDDKPFLHTLPDERGIPPSFALITKLSVHNSPHRTALDGWTDDSRRVVSIKMVRNILARNAGPHEHPTPRSISLCPLPTRQVTALKIDLANRSFSTQDWPMFFRAFPLLELLQIDGCPPAGLFGALVLSDDVPLRACPNLQSVRLRLTEDLSPDSLEPLVACASTRHANRKGLTNIDILRSVSTGDEMLSKLKTSLVPLVARMELREAEMLEDERDDQSWWT